MTDKEKFMEMLPMVGVAAESIASAIEIYSPCIMEALVMYRAVMGNTFDREEVFTPEEIKLIESIDAKLLKTEKAIDRYGY